VRGVNLVGVVAAIGVFTSLFVFAEKNHSVVDSQTFAKSATSRTQKFVMRTTMRAATPDGHCYRRRRPPSDSTKTITLKH
jgi:hypothetical protein